MGKFYRSSARVDKLQLRFTVQFAYCYTSLLSCARRPALVGPPLAVLSALTAFNMSDHLPIVTKSHLSLLTSTSTSTSPAHAPRLDWDSGRRQGCLSLYSSLTSSAVATLPERDYSSIQSKSPVCWSILHSPPFHLQNTLRFIKIKSMTLIYQPCAGAAVLLSVNGKQRAPPD